ncbi:hypothetical protein ACTJLC_22545 [Paraburkholderia sp. 22099]|jgi:hypothetical protein|uniref:Uncharacterized protein n=1 Tax=Paraburkholderia terricola TaxID=169427 RepID=A0A1M6U9E1_9BURK|nr:MULTISPECIES: hypothetical protein [Paraburkholderia]MDR6493885.1 hypothetical protein [Paraburkholderia terricola]ORC49639.1 hypothetical protein B2G74_16900 [Burkholderia sp. A27]SDO88467.1 hypothetical protein SAMN05192547_103143 [Paraburkholderia sediminicola]SHK65678.1 hypothetical protein SAMN05192548_103136 [Paraburkholderia terricola]
MKRFAFRLLLALALTIPIGWLLGLFDWFWMLAKSPAGHRVLGWAAVPFEPLDGESADDPIVVVMLAISFVIAAALVWGAPAAVRIVRRQIR